MTSIVFETATIADVIKKAAQIAPSKSGSAFDKAAGIVLDLDPSGAVKCVVRSTNEDVFYIEAVDCISADGDAKTWRLSSILLGHVVGTLPTGGNNVNVKLEDDPDKNRVILTSGRMKAAMTKMDASAYPTFGPADHVTYTPIQSVGGRIAQVAWAAGKGEAPLNGIHFTGTHILATDRARVARVTCVADLPHPVTVPAGLLGTILKQTADIEVGLDSSLMYFRPDEYTQISTITYDLQYPPVEKVVKTDYEGEVKIRKNELIERINRSMGFAGANRSPLLRVFFGKQEIAAILGEEEVGLIRDVIDVPGYADHERIEIGFNPKYLVDGLSNAPNDQVLIKYDITKYTPAVYIDGGSGWEAWIMTRRLGS